MNDQLFRQDPTDPQGGALVSPAGLLMLAAGAVEAPDGNAMDPTSAAAVFSGLLGAARAGGFAGVDVAATVLLGNFNLSRKTAAALHVCEHIEPEAYFAALSQAGFNVRD